MSQARNESDLLITLHNAAASSQLSSEQLQTALSLIRAKDGVDSVDPDMVTQTRGAASQGAAGRSRVACSGAVAGKMWEGRGSFGGKGRARPTVRACEPPLFFFGI